MPECVNELNKDFPKILPTKRTILESHRVPPLSGILADRRESLVRKLRAGVVRDDASGFIVHDDPPTRVRAGSGADVDLRLKWLVHAQSVSAMPECVNELNKDFPKNLSVSPLDRNRSLPRVRVPEAWIAPMQREGRPCPDSSGCGVWSAWDRMPWPGIGVPRPCPCLRHGPSMPMPPPPMRGPGASRPTPSRPTHQACHRPSGEGQKNVAPPPV